MKNYPQFQIGFLISLHNINWSMFQISRTVWHCPRALPEIHFDDHHSDFQIINTSNTASPFRLFAASLL